MGVRSDSGLSELLPNIGADRDPCDEHGSLTQPETRLLDRISSPHPGKSDALVLAAKIKPVVSTQSGVAALFRTRAILLKGPR